MTERRRQVFDAICAFVGEKNYAPTIREIGDRVGLTSSSTVTAHVRALRDKGFISWDPGKPRTIRVLKPAAHAAESTGQ